MGKYCSKAMDFCMGKETKRDPAYVYVPCYTEDPTLYPGRAPEGGVQQGVVQPVTMGAAAPQAQAPPPQNQVFMATMPQQQPALQAVMPPAKPLQTNVQMGSPQPMQMLPVMKVPKQPEPPQPPAPAEPQPQPMQGKMVPVMGIPIPQSRPQQGAASPAASPAERPASAVPGGPCSNPDRPRSLAEGGGRGSTYRSRTSGISSYPSSYQPACMQWMRNSGGEGGGCLNQVLSESDYSTGRSYSR